MKVGDIGPLRLSAQRLTTGKFERPEEVVRHLLALQAQDYNGALWSIGLRTESAGLSDVERAIAERRIVRTWPMRGTLHILHADDVKWMVDLLAPRATAAAKNRRIKTLGLTDDIVARAEEILRAELSGSRSIARSDVVGLLDDGIEGFAITSQHTQHLMRHFGERGVICFGPNQGKQPTFVLLDEWIEGGEKKPKTEALAELATRYFMSHGPASLKDFAGWGMLTMHDARAGLDAALPNLEAMDCEGISYYSARGLEAVVQRDPLLLPGFDEYLLGYKERGAVLAAEYADRIVPGGNGMFLPTIISDAQVVGLWKRQLRKTSVAFTYETFRTDKHPKIDTSAAEKRYHAFIFG